MAQIGDASVYRSSQNLSQVDRVFSSIRLPTMKILQRYFNRISVND